jgi:hypothetical protein
MIVNNELGRLYKSILRFYPSICLERMRISAGTLMKLEF